MSDKKFILPSETLQVDKIQLIPLIETDFEELYSVASDPLIWEQHPTSDRYKKDVFQLYFEGAIKSESAFKIYDAEKNTIMGSTRYYEFDSENSTVSIGFTFMSRDYWGGEINFKIKKLLIDYAFKTVDSVLFHIGENNIRSQKSILKIGAKRIEDKEIELYGKKVLSFQYEIKKSDWES